MLEPFAAHLPIPPPQSLRLAIAELEDHRCISELQVPTPHSPHDFHSLQLTTAHCCPLQQTSSGWRPQSKGTFLNSSEGDTIIKFQHRNIKSPESARGSWVFLESLWAHLAPFRFTGRGWKLRSLSRWRTRGFRYSDLAPFDSVL